LDRKAQILEAARRQGRVTVDGLAERLGVSPHTIRRDLNTLCDAAKLRRLHGGAAYIEGQANIPYPARAVLNLGAKLAIGRAVAAIVPDGATVFLSIGTTPALVASALARRRHLTVVTNNLDAALALSNSEGARIVIPGGEVRLPDRDLLGADAIALFATYRADFGIYGVGGIDSDGSLLDFHAPEVRARESIRQNSRAAILVADRTKFGRRAAAVGGHLCQADHVVIDRLPDGPYAALLDSLPGRLVLADEREQCHA